MSRLAFLRIPQPFLEAYSLLDEKFLRKGYRLARPVSFCINFRRGEWNEVDKTRQRQPELLAGVAKTFHKLEFRMHEEDLWDVVRWNKARRNLDRLHMYIIKVKPRLNFRGTSKLVKSWRRLPWSWGSSGPLYDLWHSSLRAISDVDVLLLKKCPPVIQCESTMTDTGKVNGPWTLNVLSWSSARHPLYRWLY